MLLNQKQMLLFWFSNIFFRGRSSNIW